MEDPRRLCMDTLEVTEGLVDHDLVGRGTTRENRVLLALARPGGGASDPQPIERPKKIKN